jgi:hypothetical protein
MDRFLSSSPGLVLAVLLGGLAVTLSLLASSDSPRPSSQTEPQGSGTTFHLERPSGDWAFDVLFRTSGEWDVAPPEPLLLRNEEGRLRKARRASALFRTRGLVIVPQRFCQNTTFTPTVGEPTVVEAPLDNPAKHFLVLESEPVAKAEIGVVTIPASMTGSVQFPITIPFSHYSSVTVRFSEYQVEKGPVTVRARTADGKVCTGSLSFQDATVLATGTVELRLADRDIAMVEVSYGASPERIGWLHGPTELPIVRKAGPLLLSATWNPVR